MKPELIDWAPVGSVSAFHPSGPVQTDVFAIWFGNFVKHVKPTPEEPLLLVLDEYSTYTRNVEVTEKARKCHVAVFCVAPHRTHSIQPMM
jgi:hypothetical protein